MRARAMHVGIIPDGNRRWARRHGVSLQHAYGVGFRNGIDLAVRLPELGFRHLTFFGLTNTNYIYRPSDQVEALLSQIIDSMISEISTFLRNGINIRFYGDISQLGLEHQHKLVRIEKSTTSIKTPEAFMSVLVNYSPEWDLRAGSEHFATRSIPACDFIFRSGKVKRLSGFLPMQSANASLYFSPQLWPDVQPDNVIRVMSRLSHMKRRFGA
jgi:undecaprenyl diphosphate synthase